jgi:hypothetical protein
MSRLRVQSFAISIDGYGAGPDQDLQNPLGVGGPDLMEWVFHTRMWRKTRPRACSGAGTMATPAVRAGEMTRAAQPATK